MSFFQIFIYLLAGVVVGPFLQENFPQLRILARAISRQHACELLRRGVTEVYRETFGSALDLSVGALGVLGVEKERAVRAAEIFRKHDEASVRAMALLDEEGEAHASTARLHIENLERALASDREMFAAMQTGASAA